MKSWLPKNIFAVNKCSSIGAETFNHCSSLCPHDDGVLLAWYSGSNECQDDQSVYITYLSNNRHLPPIRIGDKTGNPIVWRENDRTWLLWSKFEDLKPSKILAHRWRYCSLWIQEVKVSDGIELSKPVKIADASKNLLAITNPIILLHRATESQLILPLYDEDKRQCVIFQGGEGQFQEISRYGNAIIQPALWADGGRIHSLSRNFGNRQRKALYYSSSDDGNTWHRGGPSFFQNINNSIAVHEWSDLQMVLWNNSESIYRTDMALGIISWGSGVPIPCIIKTINQRHGSYPCLCVDNDDQLHFAFTSPTRQIEYHVWNKKTFKQEFKRNRNPARRTR